MSAAAGAAGAATRASEDHHPSPAVGRYTNLLPKHKVAAAKQANGDVKGEKKLNIFGTE